MSLYILQYRGTSLISRAIEIMTWGNYSHSAIANSDGTLVEAWEGNGTTHAMSPWENHTKGTLIDMFALDTRDEFQINPLNEQRIWAAALELVGTKYDFAAILGFVAVSRCFWHDSPEKWFCSHLVAHCCRTGGAPLFSQQTPLYKLSPSKIPWSPRLKWVAQVKDEEEWSWFLSGGVK